MQAVDIIVFIAIVLVLVGATIWLRRSEAKTKNKHKMTAYSLLEEKSPDPKKIKNTIRLLSLYGGRFRRDQEFDQLIKMLSELLHEIEDTGARSEFRIRK
jgi:CRISPR/Cas system CSM-associated protein Csm2 small subunit